MYVCIFGAWSIQDLISPDVKDSNRIAGPKTVADGDKMEVEN